MHRIQFSKSTIADTQLLVGNAKALPPLRVYVAKRVGVANSYGINFSGAMSSFIPNFFSGPLSRTTEKPIQLFRITAHLWAYHPQALLRTEPLSFNERTESLANLSCVVKL